MSRALELDFFGLEKQTAAHKSQFQKFLDRRRLSLPGTNSSISKINPEVIRSVIASGDATNHQIDFQEPVPFPSPVDGTQTLVPALPVLNQLPSLPHDEHLPPPLTIFYNGSVSVFNVTPDKAESILKFAAEEWSKGRSEDPVAAIPSNNDQQQLLKTLNGDLPIARRKSLQRFLEKRKERLTSLSPYQCQTRF